jgi:hypothetical protein
MASVGLSPLTPLARLLADPTHHPSGSACAGYVKGKGCPSSPPVSGSASASETSAIANTTVSCLVAALVLGAVIVDALRGRDTWSTKFRLRRTANWFPVALCYGGFYLYVHEHTHDPYPSRECPRSSSAPAKPAQHELALNRSCPDPHDDTTIHPSLTRSTHLPHLHHTYVAHTN